MSIAGTNIKAQALDVGDAAPPWYGMTRDRSFRSSESQYGRPAVMLLFGSQIHGGPDILKAMITPHIDSVANAGADLLVMIDDNPALLAIADRSIQIVDAGDLLARCGVTPVDALVLAVDRNQRLVMVSTLTPEVIPTCVACVRQLPTEAPRNIDASAPVIMLPNLLSTPACHHLIDLFDTSPSIESGVARVDQNGVCGNVIDYTRKRRRDLLVDEGSPLHQCLHDTLLRRCRPEIAKAFQVRVAHLDRILIARYDEAGGWFGRHRDNDARQVAFREFALSVNLNAGAYEGGHLVFPEYNDHRYAPPTGGGLIFSASVLHAATPVTAGARYVLLTFLHSDAAEKRRRDHQIDEARRQLTAIS